MGCPRHKYFRHALAITALAITTSGCFLHQVANDGVNFRQSLLDMYTDQIMDNLIRASQNRPFAQLSYRSLIVTDFQMEKLSVSDEADPTHSHTLAATTGALLTSMRSFTDKVVFGVNGERDRTMEFTSDPVTGQNDVYEDYLAFASDPTLFRVSHQEPRCGFHIKKKCGDRWYWVPADAGGVFLQLALKTTFMRGAETPPPFSWDATIASMEPGWGSNAGPHPEPSQYNYTFTFQDSVPNDNALTGFHMIVELDDCRELSIHLTENPAAVVKGKIPPTTKLYGQYNSPLPDLTGRHVKVFAPSVPNLGTETPDQVRLRTAVENYRSMIKAAAAN